jgi:hypothetical protein
MLVDLARQRSRPLPRASGTTAYLPPTDELGTESSREHLLHLDKEGAWFSSGGMPTVRM